MPWWGLLLAAAGAYLVGAVPVGYLLVRALKGIDIRTQGSGSVGATNAARVLGRRAFFVVFGLDALKGLLPTAAAGMLAGYAWGRGPAPLAAVLCALAAVAGHNWPAYIGFRGGKGVATSFGALLYVAPESLPAALLVWGVAAWVWRYVSLASVLAALAAATATVAVWHHAGRLGEAKFAVAFVCLAAAAVVVRHRSNLLRLCKGTEPKLGAKKAPAGEDVPDEGRG